MDHESSVALEALLQDLLESILKSAKNAKLAAERLAERRHLRPRRGGAPGRLAAGLLDEAVFSVRWNGRECELGYTIAFRLIRKLASRPNQYVSHEQLLDGVWEGVRSPSAIRSAVNDLRARLAAAGMEDLAGAIDGSNPGHYGLRLDRVPFPRNSDGDRTASGR